MVKTKSIIGFWLMGLLLLSSCSDDDTAIGAAADLANRVQEEAGVLQMIGIYEGFWSVGGAEIGDGKLYVKQDGIEFVLPEENLMYIQYAEYAFGLEECILSGTQQQVTYDFQGYSEESLYANQSNKNSYDGQDMFDGVGGYELENASFAEDVPIPDGNAFCFGFFSQGIPYRAEMSGNYGAVALFNMVKGGWTIILPNQNCSITNLSTGEQVWSSDAEWASGLGAQGLVFTSTKKIL